MNAPVELPDQRVMLRTVEWDTYVSLSDSNDRLGCRMFYHEGELELMSPSLIHEIERSLLGRMVERYAELRQIDMRSSASTTFRRKDLCSGFEADESFYIQHEISVRGKREVDLTMDPPPDIVVEIENTKSAINKLEVFAMFKVPEVWTYDGTSLWIGRLQDGAYQHVEQSVALDGFPVSPAEELLRSVSHTSETELIRRFVDGCR